MYFQLTIVRNLGEIREPDVFLLRCGKETSTLFEFKIKTKRVAGSCPEERGVSTGLPHHNSQEKQLAQL